MFGFKKTDGQAPESALEAYEAAVEKSQTEVVNPTMAEDVATVAVRTSLRTSTAAGRYFKQAPSQILKPSIISEGFELIGDITSTGGLHVEGKIHGKINVDNVTIGAKGSVKGSIRCNALNIKGTFDGEATCDMLNLSGNAVVNGDVQYRSLTMSTGAVLTGNLKRS